MPCSMYRRAHMERDPSIDRRPSADVEILFERRMPSSCAVCGRTMPSSCAVCRLTGPKLTPISPCGVGLPSVLSPYKKWLAAHPMVILYNEVGGYVEGCAPYIGLLSCDRWEINRS